MSVFRSETITLDRDSDGSAMLKIDVPGRAVNVITAQLMNDLDAALDAVGRERPPLLVVYSGKKTGFLAGADLAGFLAIRDSAAAEALSARGQRLFDKLAALPIPVVASVSGPCLGGALELALACDYRLVFDAPNTQLGLPEVTLGLLPGWGGTQRLPRTIGLEPALQVILAGKRLDAREALRWGLADAVAGNEAQLREQFDRLKGRALTDGKRPRKGLPLRTWRQRLLESTWVGRRVLLRAAERLVRQRTPDDMPAPAEALEAVRVGVQEGMPAGLEAERKAAGRLAMTPACRHLIGLFFAREQARKLPAEVPARPVRRVGVVGAGVMGAGIAQLAAIRDCEVVVQEVNADALGAGVHRIGELFRKAVERHVLTEADAARKLAAVKGTVTWEGFDTVDLVVEAAAEDPEIKRKVFRELEARTRPDAVLATNTSSLLVSRLQEGLARPERVGGLHFFNPVHKMDLVEVARTPATAATTADQLLRFAAALGKTPVLVGDGPGFVVNRVLMPYLNEATLLVAEGLSVADVDGPMKRFGMPMGPLELLDQIGLDVAAHVAAAMGPVLAERFGANDAFERMRRNGWLGVKSGRGFYDHKGGKAKPNVLAENLLRTGHEAGGVTRALARAARQGDARERLVLLMVNEAALALSEGLAADAATIDLAMVLGTGWAPQRGGPLHYADDRGLAAVVQALESLAALHGKRFEPCAELRRRAASGERFTPPTGAEGAALSPRP